MSVEPQRSRASSAGEGREMSIEGSGLVPMGGAHTKDVVCPSISMERLHWQLPLLSGATMICVMPVSRWTTALPALQRVSLSRSFASWVEKFGVLVSMSIDQRGGDAS